MKRSIGTLAAVILAVMGCQSYDAEPVSPNAVEVQDTSKTIVANRLAPNIMLVVDRSGSMTDNASGTISGACDNSSGVYSGNRATDCKWNNLLDVLLGTGNTTYVVDAGFIGALSAAFADDANNGDPVPIGLSMLPGTSTAAPGSVAYSCAEGATSSNIVLNPIQGGNQAAIASSLVAIQAGGGTPTAATLSVVGTSFPGPVSGISDSAQPADYVILMTDGAPNCDSAFPMPSATDCSGDRCTLGDCAASQWGTSMCACFDTQTGSNLAEGCLDENATVSTIAGLYNGSPQIKTFVIGFGAAAAGGSISETLEEMGQAGQTGSSNGYNANSYYAAADQAGLQAALQAILGIINQTKCQYTLEGAPPSQQLIEIIVTPSGGSAETLAQSQFTYDPTSETVNITDMGVCGTILASTPNTPVKVEIKYLQDE